MDLEYTTPGLLLVDVDQEKTPYTIICYRLIGKGQVYILEFENSNDIATIMDGDNNLTSYYDMILWYDLS